MKKEKSFFQRAASYLSKTLGIKDKSAKQKIRRAAIGQTKKPKIDNVSRYGKTLFNKAKVEKKVEIQKRVEKIQPKVEPIKSRASFIRNLNKFNPGKPTIISVDGEFYISNGTEKRTINLYLTAEEAQRVVNSDDKSDALESWLEASDNDFIGEIKSANSITIKGNW